MFGSRKEILALNEALDEANKKLVEIEKQYASVRLAIENMPEGVVLVGKDTKIISINPAIEKIFGISQEKTEGRLFLEAIRNNDISEIIHRVLKTGESVLEEFDLIWPVQKIFQVNGLPIFEKEEISRCLIVIHDITQIRKLETVRRDFVANVSHELKTPLTSIKGFVETLLEGALEDEENNRKFLEIIHEHTNRLDVLVDDLLDLSYLESQELGLEKEEVNLKDLVDRVLSGFKTQLKKKAISSGNDLPSNLSLNLDKNKIEQVFTNLIDNGIKFNQEKGSLKIYCQDLDNKVKIIIEDTGVGIPFKDIPRIFERFYRVDKARSRQLGGTGLGLSIVKHIIELHGGSVGVESIDGLGSKFWFVLPK